MAIPIEKSEIRPLLEFNNKQTEAGAPASTHEALLTFVDSLQRHDCKLRYCILLYWSVIYCDNKVLRCLVLRSVKALRCEKQGS